MSKKNLKVLGIHWGGHDTSASITVNGKLLAAAEQERYDYIKHSRQFPTEAINDCLKIAKLKIKDIDIVAYGSIPKLEVRERYHNLLEKFPERKKFLTSDKSTIKRNLNMEQILRKKLNFKKKIDFNLHHLCHLYSTFCPSGFKKSLIISYDGIGEIGTAMFGIGYKDKIKIIHNKNNFPDSLGLIYSAITFYLGWNHHCDEGIIMGLAPYGNAKEKIPKINKTYIDIFKEIIVIDKNDPLKFKINLDWIDYHKNKDTWVSKKFLSVFGKKRNNGEEILKRHKNIAAALQLRLEEVVLKQLKHLKSLHKINYLCISGGVGLNCSLNGKISSNKIFKEIFVQPASGDAGISYGACLVSTKRINKSLKFKKNWNFYTGSRENENDFNKILKKKKLNYKDYGNNVFKKTAQLLAEGKIIGWFQGSSEFGPRALGNRSIFCKPYPLNMKDYINKKVKFREKFRPFAPAVMNEYLKKFFDIRQESPHMLIACKVKKNKKKIIPATVHVDGTCRVQSVSKKTNLRFWRLLKEFYKETNVPVLLNTSFNIKGQPIVNTSEDAIKCFLKYNINCLVLGNYILEKK